MFTYVVVATVVSFFTAWLWYKYLFPKAAAESMGSEEAALAMQGRNMLLTVIALVVLSAATGVFISNRGILDNVDLIKLGIKIWFGFFLPIILVSWAYTKVTVTTLIAHAGLWLVVAVEFAIITSWLLL